MLQIQTRMICNGNELKDGQLQFYSLKEEKYIQDKLITLPIHIELNCNIPIQIEKAQIHSEPSLFKPIILENTYGENHQWEIDVIVKPQELFGAFPMKLIFDYEYS